MKTRKLIALILCVSLLLCLSACGKKADKSLLGKYICSHITMYNVDFPASDIYENETSVTLKSGGKADFILNGESFAAKWEAQDGSIILNTDDADLYGTIGGGVITFTNFLDSDMNLYFAMDGVEIASVISAASSSASDASSEQAQTPVEEYNEVQQGWNGKWYGWWSITNAEGMWETVGDGAWWDCMAEIYVDENGNGTIILWDEETQKDDPMASVVISASDTDAVSKSGFFWLSDLGVGTWDLNYNGSNYDNLVVIENQHYEAVDGAFDYVIYLRPWGQLWDDIAEDNPDNLPENYNSWYLPLVEAGETSDVIPAE